VLLEKYDYKPLFPLGLAKNILAQPDFVNLNSAQNCRLIPQTASDTQTAMEYCTSNPHFAVIGCSDRQRSIHQKLEDLASENQNMTKKMENMTKGLGNMTKRMSELEAKTIKIQAANLRTAALRTAALRKCKGALLQVSEEELEKN